MINPQSRMEISNFDRYKLGQWVYLYIPEVAWCQVHPFSVISKPTTDNRLTLLLSVAGNWTRNLDRIIAENPEQIQRVWVDGGYGSLCVAPPKDYKLVVFIAGGAGIGPMLSLLNSLQDLPDADRPQIFLFWACRSMELVSAFHNEILELQYIFGSKLSVELYHSNRSMGLELVELEELANTKILDILQHSRPDFNQLFKSARAQAKSLGASSVGVYVCGSSSITKSVLRNARSTCSMSFHVHVESFSL